MAAILSPSPSQNYRISFSGFFCLPCQQLVEYLEEKCARGCKTTYVYSHQGIHILTQAHNQPLVIYLKILVETFYMSLVSEKDKQMPGTCVSLQIPASTDFGLVIFTVISVFSDEFNRSQFLIYQSFFFFCHVTMVGGIDTLCNSASLILYWKTV